MANENNVIKSLNPTNFNGVYEATESSYKVAGNLTTNGSKELTNVNGTVKSGETFLANFDGYNNGSQGQMRYSFRDVVDIDQMGAISAAVKAVVAEIVAELAQ